MTIAMYEFIDETWSEFLNVLHEDILPVYEKHGNTFDNNLIHERMHICRALIFGEFMCRYYYQETSITPSIISVRYAIAFHDSGRQGNGIDIWEHDSSKNCSCHLASHPIKGAQSPEATGDLITKDGLGGWGIEKRIVHDADVLDIMRPCCGHGGREGFRERALRFLGPRDRDTQNDRGLYIRGQLIEECWGFINNTENKKMDLSTSSDYMRDVLGILKSIGEDCPLLSKYILRK